MYSFSLKKEEIKSKVLNKNLEIKIFFKNFVGCVTSELLISLYFAFINNSDVVFIYVSQLVKLKNSLLVEIRISLYKKVKFNSHKQEK